VVGLEVTVGTNLTPFDTNWKKGSGATPLTTQDLFFWDELSIPTAPTNYFIPLGLKFDLATIKLLR